MKSSKYEVKFTNQFKKDYKLAKKRGLPLDKLDKIISSLAMGKTLPEKNKDHALVGNWVGHRECYIQPDWLLVYYVDNDILVLLWFVLVNTVIFYNMHLNKINWKIIVLDDYFL